MARTSPSLRANPPGIAARFLSDSSSVEVQSTNHPGWTPLGWGGDGTITDAGGFGEGAFSIRLTSVDDQQLTDTFPAFTPGGLLTSSGQFE